jgi:phosphatidylinositol alpha-1,6-mannosyltransferase
MKILLITMEYPPDRGGVGNYYYNLVRNFGEEVKVDVLVNKSEIQNSKSETNSNNQNPKPKIIKKKFFYKLFWPRWLKLFWQVRRLVKDKKYDYLWAGQVLPVGTVAYLINKFYKIPYFVSAHGMDVLMPQRSNKKKKLLREILSQAKFITANSNFTRDKIFELGVLKDKVKVIYPCGHVNQSVSNLPADKINEVKSRLKLQNKKIILSVGRLVARKGFDLMIKAMPHLLEDYDNLVYLIIGDGPDKERLGGLIGENRLKGKVYLINDVSDDFLPLFYQLADVFVMPCRQAEADVEGFGIVFLEAAAFGTPAVAGNSGGVPEAVLDQRTGLLIDPRSQFELVGAIGKLFENDDFYRQLAAEALKHSAGFNWTEQSARLKDLIKNYDG